MWSKTTRKVEPRTLLPGGVLWRAILGWVSRRWVGSISLRMSAYDIIVDNTFYIHTWKPCKTHLTWHKYCISDLRPIAVGSFLLSSSSLDCMVLNFDNILMRFAFWKYCNWGSHYKGRLQNLQSRKVSVRGVPPPTQGLNGQDFSVKLAKEGGSPPPSLTDPNSKKIAPQAAFFGVFHPKNTVFGPKS